MIFTVFLTFFLAFSSAATLLGKDALQAIPGEYIVVFHPEVGQEKIALHLKGLNFGDGESIMSTFQIGTFRGYSAKMSEKLLETELASPDVQYIETNQVVQANQACVVQNGATWGLNRVDERQLDLDDTYVYTSTAASGVDAYIIDTGILTSHIDFGGRATWMANFVDTTNTDCNGHGTHVAGTVGGLTWGIAKMTNLLAVKVLDCSGSGSTAGVVKGIEFTVTSYQTRKNPSVSNMSLGGGKSTALDMAVQAAVKAGVTFVVAAGNSNADACNYSPADVPEAITVGATTVEDTDARSYFSNYGKCVDIFAPGELITSAWIGSNTATRTISGTSMASPHTAGVVALFLNSNPSATPAQVTEWINAEATLNLINLDCTTSVCLQSPNALLYSPCS